MLGQQVQAAVRSVIPDTKVGVLVLDTTTGAPVASLNPTEQFHSASVVKLLIALDALHTAQWSPDQDMIDQLHQMLVYSDDNVADALWDDNGGNSIVTRMVSLIGLTETQPPTDPTEWGETLLSAQDVVATYAYLTTQVPAPALAVIMNALSSTSRIAADGTDQFFGIPDGLPGTSWAIKQGWMDLDSETTLNTTGLVGPSQRYAVAVLTSMPAGTSWAGGGSALTAGIAALKPTIG